MAIEQKCCALNLRITAGVKLKIRKYADKKRISEAEVVRRALKNFLHNTIA